MDTSNILFICGGTFVGLEDIIRRRLGRKTIGFGLDRGERNEQTVAELLPQVHSDDILEFGLIPELVGRLPVVCALSPLNEVALLKILTEPKNALVKQYQSLFAMEGCELSFTDEALTYVAKTAKEKGTGARGLRSVIEDVMLDIMYELPDQPDGSHYTITPEVITGEKRLFPVHEEEKKSA
jgi:ATP-dependent Clp protease ATP-binding subunit ClpX